MKGGLRGLRQSGGGGGSDQVIRNVLVVVQVAAALVLLVGSGLLVQSFRALSSVDPGYDTEDIFTFQMAPDAGEHNLSDGPTFAQFHYAFMDRLTDIPTVESVGLVNTLPLDEGAGMTRFITHRMGGTDDTPPILRLTMAGGDYFQTMGIGLLSGSYFERDPNPASEVKVIVSRSAADLLWPNEEPLGQLLKPAGADSTFNWMTVWGVVEDVMLTDFREETPEPMVYLPMVGQTARSWAVGTPAYVVKSSRAESIGPEIREIIREMAPSAPMYRTFTMADLAGRSMSRLSFTMLMLVIAAGLALILSAVGIYGTLSYVVSQRTREIGIRMSLGAEGGRVRRMVVAQGVRVALMGVALGLIAALLMTRVLDSLLFGVDTIDPVTFIAVSGLMIGVALLASYHPARRASSVDPMRSLRVE